MHGYCWQQSDSKDYVSSPRLKSMTALTGSDLTNHVASENKKAKKTSALSQCGPIKI